MELLYPQQSGFIKFKTVKIEIIYLYITSIGSAKGIIC